MRGREEWRILYEIICCAEWKETGETLGAGVGRRTLTPSKNQLGSDWVYALSPDLQLLAILQDSSLEVRSAKDNYASTVGKNTQAPGVVKDTHPWLRQLAWNQDSSLLAIAFTNGLITFFDASGSHLCSIRTEGEDIGGPPPFSPTLAFASLFFLPDRISVAPSLKCLNELVAVSSRGVLKCYRQPSGEGAALTFHHDYSFRRFYPQGVHQIQHVQTHSILIVAGPLHLSSKDEPDMSHAHGITSWRILHDHPYYRIVHSVQDPQHSAGLRPALGLWSIALSWTKQYSALPFGNSSQDSICKITLSADGKRMAGIHESGGISVWHVPSLRSQYHWPLVVQMKHDTENPQFNQRWRAAFNNNANQPLDPVRFHPFDVNWWGNDKLIISRVNGCVTLVSVDDENLQRNLLGDSPELFECPMAVFPRGEGRGFLALDCEVRQGKNDSGNGRRGKWRLTSFATESLFWLMDIERFRPAPKKRPASGLNTLRTYRFYSLQSITPMELFHRRIEAEEYGDALDLAKMYELDADLVYQRQWTRAPVSLHSIKDYLAKIGKRNWVMQECLERLPDTIEATRELLEFGLKGTDLTPAVLVSQGRDKGRFIIWSRDDLDISESEYISLIDPENEEVVRLLRYRQQFLHFLDMLNTYEVMLGGPLRAEENFDPVVFGRLRSQSPWESGMQMANDCDISGLRTILTYHWPNMKSRYLEIISSFPEIIPPHDYRDFLPSIEEDGTVILWGDIARKESDWSHEFLPLEGNDVGPEVTPSILEAWYDRRIREIESRTGLVNFALDLANLGLERNIQSLSKLAQDLETVEVLVYQVELDYITLGTLESMGHFDRLVLLMSNSTDETFLTHMQELVFPFLAKCEERIPESRLALLNQYLSSLAVKDLHLVLKLFEASKVEEVDHPLISNLEELMALAYNAIYACENPKENKNILAILGCIPDRGFGVAGSKLQALHDSIDELEVHYTMTQTLGKYDIWLTVTQVEALTAKNEEEAEEFVQNICYAAIRMVPPMKLDHWKALLYDLLDLKKKILHSLSHEKCFEFYVSALLRSGMESVMNLAKDFVGAKSGAEKYSSVFSLYLTNIPTSRIADMILDAAQTYFDSASSYSDVDMSHAKTALALLPPDHSKKAEALVLVDLIDALKIINKDFNLDILPLTVRGTRNRLNLIQTAMKNLRQGYRKTQQLLKLSILLRVGQEIPGDKQGESTTTTPPIRIMSMEEVESVIMEMCGEAGMDEGDLTWVIQLCHTIMAKGYGVGWGLFYQLAKLESESELDGEPSLLDHGTRLAFINHALGLCPPDQILILLKTKYLIEIRSLQSRLKELSPVDTSMEPDPDEFNATTEVGVSIVNDILQKTRLDGILKTTTSWINPLKDLAGGKLLPWKGQGQESSLGFNPQGVVQAGNDDFDKEGYSAFHLGSCSEETRQLLHTSQLCYGYDSFSSPVSPLLPTGTPSPALELCLILHRIWYLEKLIVGGKSNEPQDSDVVSCLVCDILPEDISWGLAILLSIEDHDECLRILSTLPQTPTLHLVRLYYLALTIKKTIDGSRSIEENNLCYLNPNELIVQVRRICEEELPSTDYASSQKKPLHNLTRQFQQYLDEAAAANYTD